MESTGISFTRCVSKGNTFNDEDYRVKILTGLLPLRPQVDGRRFVIHANNARPHTARKSRAFYEENPLRLAVYSPYSVDLAPSDFLLFGDIKHCLQGTAFPTTQREDKTMIRRLL
jgi:hypothetical protein